MNRRVRGSIVVVENTIAGIPQFIFEVRCLHCLVCNDEFRIYVSFKTKQTVQHGIHI